MIDNSNNNSELDVSGARSNRPSWPRHLAWLPLLGGIGIGIYILSAPLGVWLGWWNFSKGFQILISANNIKLGLWFAGGCAGVGVIAIVLSKILNSGKITRTTVFTIAGVILSLLAYYAPQTYRPQEGVPPIHDITTDTDNPPQFVAVLPLRADAPNSTEYGAGEGMTPQTLAELQKGFYKDIEPLRLAQPKNAVFAKALEVVHKLGWELVAQVPGEGRIETTDTTFWFRFKDDIVIRIESQGDETLVNVRSVSRVGRSDVGKNAARIKEFLAQLQE